MTEASDKLSLKIPRFSGGEPQKWEEWMYQFQSVLEASDLLDTLFEPNPAAGAALTTISTDAADKAGDVPSDTAASQESGKGVERKR